MADVRLFDLDEANTLIPRLALMMERVQAHLAKLDALASRLDAHGAVDTAQLVAADPDARAWIEAVQSATADLLATGAHLKDVRLGLVDFPTRVGGEVVYLCWQYGESAIGYWHRVEDGFQGRQPLPGPRPVRSLQ